MSWRLSARRFAAWLLVLAVFAAHGAWPTPDENETVYLTKAKHWADPTWCAGDLFLESADAHAVFYALTAWATRWLSLAQFAWLGRGLTWMLQAAAWSALWRATGGRWLRRGVLAVAGPAVTAAWLVLANDQGHQSGEWLVGGFEAKGPAYACVWWAWAAVLGRSPTLAPFWLGAAIALHPLVGGWNALAVAAAWLVGPRRLRHPGRWLVSTALGLALALAGMRPALNMDRDTPGSLRGEANKLYVQLRLAHHLWPPAIPTERIGCHLALVAGVHGLAWVVWRALPSSAPRGRWGRTLLRQLAAGWLVAGAVSLLGVWIAHWPTEFQGLANRLLRFYWFRLGDLIWPLGLAVLIGWALAIGVTRPGGAARLFRAAVLAVALAAVGHDAWLRATAPVARAERPMSPELAAEWRAMCAWVAAETPREALFFTPRLAQSFKWHAGRAEVVNWKDLPQDARRIVAWHERIDAIHLRTGPDGARYGRQTDLSPHAWRQRAERFGAQFLVARAYPPLALPRVYANRRWAVYDLRTRPSDVATPPQ